MEDLQSASKLLIKALKMRERYMKQSRQKFPNLVDGYIRGSEGSATQGMDAGAPNKATIEGTFSYFTNLAFNVFFSVKVVRLSEGLIET